MKRFLRKHIMIIVIAIGLYGFIAYQIINYKNMLNRNAEAEAKTIEYCETNYPNIENQDMLDLCKQSLSSATPEIDFYSIMTDFVVFEFQFLNILSFALLVVPTAYRLCAILNNKCIVNSRSRQSLNAFMRQYYKTAYRYIWLLPVAAIILVIFAASVSTFDTTYLHMWNTSKWDSNIINYPTLFILSYILNIFLHSLFFINLALLICRKVHKFIPATIVCFVTYLGLELFLELVINIGICQMIFNSGFGIVFNIVNMWSFSDAYGVLAVIIFIFLLCVLSSFCVWTAYKNKESLIIDCEKNN